MDRKTRAHSLPSARCRICCCTSSDTTSLSWLTVVESRTASFSMGVVIGASANVGRAISSERFGVLPRGFFGRDFFAATVPPCAFVQVDFSVLDLLQKLAHCFGKFSRISRHAVHGDTLHWRIPNNCVQEISHLDIPAFVKAS